MRLTFIKSVESVDFIKYFLNKHIDCQLYNAGVGGMGYGVSARTSKYYLYCGQDRFHFSIDIYDLEKYNESNIIWFYKKPLRNLNNLINHCDLKFKSKTSEYFYYSIEYIYCQLKSLQKFLKNNEPEALKINNPSKIISLIQILGEVYSGTSIIEAKGILESFRIKSKLIDKWKVKAAEKKH